MTQFRAKQFISATTELVSLEITYGKLEEAQLLSQIMQSWKDPHRTRLGQLIGGCTLEYTVWRRQKIEDTVLPPTRMKVSISDPIPKQLSEIDIVRSEFASKRLEMELKYKRLQEIAKKSEKDVRVHEHKARKMIEGNTKVKDENKNLYIANKKLWVEVKDTKIGHFFGTQCKEGKASQRESNHWQT